MSEGSRPQSSTSLTGWPDLLGHVFPLAESGNRKESWQLLFFLARVNSPGPMVSENCCPLWWGEWGDWNSSDTCSVVQELALGS